MVYYIYILECHNGTYYTGYTTDLLRRFEEHLQGSIKCKYTRSFPPKQVAASWQLTVDLSQVLKIEKAIKRLSKPQKRALIADNDLLLPIIQAITGSEHAKCTTDIS